MIEYQPLESRIDLIAKSGTEDYIVGGFNSFSFKINATAIALVFQATGPREGDIGTSSTQVYTEWFPMRQERHGEYEYINISGANREIYDIGGDTGGNHVDLTGGITYSPLTQRAYITVGASNLDHQSDRISESEELRLIGFRLAYTQENEIYTDGRTDRDFYQFEEEADEPPKLVQYENVVYWVNGGKLYHLDDRTGVTNVLASNVELVDNEAIEVVGNSIFYLSKNNEEDVEAYIVRRDSYGSSYQVLQIGRNANLNLYDFTNAQIHSIGFDAVVFCKRKRDGKSVALILDTTLTDNRANDGYSVIELSQEPDVIWTSDNDIYYIYYDL